MTEQAQQLAAGGHDLVAHGLTSAKLFGFYMIGAGLETLQLVAKTRKAKTPAPGSVRVLVWTSVQGLTWSIALAFVWTQALLWVVAEQFNVPIPKFGIDKFSSIAVGFALTWFVHEKLDGRSPIAAIRGLFATKKK